MWVLSCLIKQTSQHRHLNFRQIVLAELVLDNPFINRILVSELNLVNRERDLRMLVKDTLAVVAIDKNAVAFPKRQRLSYPPLS